MHLLNNTITKVIRFGDAYHFIKSRELLILSYCKESENLVVESTAQKINNMVIPGYVVEVPIRFVRLLVDLETITENVNATSLGQLHAAWRDRLDFYGLFYPTPEEADSYHHQLLGLESGVEYYGHKSVENKEVITSLGIFNGISEHHLIFKYSAIKPAIDSILGKIECTQ